MKEKKASKVGIVVAIAGVLAVAALAVNIGRNVQEQVEEPAQTLETEDFVFERKFIHYTPDMVGSNRLGWSSRYRVSQEKNNEVLSCDDKVFCCIAFTYEKWLEPFVKQGYSYEETIEAGLSSVAENREMNLNEYLLTVYDEVKYDDDSVFRTVDEYGEVKNELIISTTSDFLGYNDLNVRFAPIGMILTNNDGEISYELASLGGKSLDDMEVSGSMAYLASLYLNQMNMYEQPYNATVTNLCTEVVNKACAQASGYTEEEYGSGVDVGAPIESGTTITMKVGETKKFEPKQLIDVQLRIDYIAASEVGSDNNRQGYTIDSAGNIKALKAGAYTVAIRCAGTLYYYTLNITQ